MSLTTHSLVTPNTAASCGVHLPVSWRPSCKNMAAVNSAAPAWLPALSTPVCDNAKRSQLPLIALLLLINPGFLLKPLYMLIVILLPTLSLYCLSLSRTKAYYKKGANFFHIRFYPPKLGKLRKHVEYFYKTGPCADHVWWVILNLAGEKKKSVNIKLSMSGLITSFVPYRCRTRKAIFSFVVFHLFVFCFLMLFYVE